MESGGRDVDINFKFLPAFLGALALSALFGQRAKAPAPRPPARAPATTAAAPRPAARAADGRPVLLVASRQGETRPAPANDQDDW